MRFLGWLRPPPFPPNEHAQIVPRPDGLSLAQCEIFYADLVQRSRCEAARWARWDAEFGQWKRDSARGMMMLFAAGVGLAAAGVAHGVTTARWWLAAVNLVTLVLNANALRKALREGWNCDI